MTTDTTTRTYGTRGARVAAGLLVAGALLAGCGEDGDDGRDDTSTVEAEQVELAGHTFVAGHVDGHELLEGTTLSITFDQGVMSVVAGCNTLFGPYVDADSELRWVDQRVGPGGASCARARRVCPCMNGALWLQIQSCGAICAAADWPHRTRRTR